MKKYIIEDGMFFKVWTAGNFRIVKHKGTKSVYPYEIQHKRENGCWDRCGRCRTLSDAKSYRESYE